MKQLGRPKILDAFGPVSSLARVTVHLSEGLKDRLMKVANRKGLSDGALVRQLVEREVMERIMAKSGQYLRSLNGLTQIVHKVNRK